MIDERPAIQRETMFSPGHDYLIYHIATYLLEKGTPILFNLAINRINEKKSDGIISVGDDITNKDRQFTNQILSTFKFIK